MRVIGAIFFFYKQCTQLYTVSNYEMKTWPTPI